ncbi:MAG: hypothetical protein P1V51_19865 [Deltaproteobacteria bacterium]|nr:hypothetical protein [Deltaproteobacteria bacterium]
MDPTGKTVDYYFIEVRGREVKLWDGKQFRRSTRGSAQGRFRRLRTAERHLEKAGSRTPSSNTLALVACTYTVAGGKRHYDDIDVTYFKRSERA